MAKARRIDDYIKSLSDSTRLERVDIESLIKKIVEETVAQTLALRDKPSTQTVDNRVAEAIMAKLVDIEERLKRVEDTLKRGAGESHVIPKSVLEELARNITATLTTILKEYCSQQDRRESVEGQNEPRWLRVLREKMSGTGFILADDLPPETRQQLDIALLESKGFIVRSIANNLLIVDPQALAEFKSMLSSLRDTSDEFEAETRLGKYSKLFRILRSGGYIYYSGPGKGWKLALEVK